MFGREQPKDQPTHKPPREDWEAVPRERFFDLKLSHWVEIFLTLALVGVGGTQVYVYLKQAHLMRQSNEQATRGTNAAVQAAKSAADANNLAAEVFVAGQRPWLKIEVLEVSGPLERDPANHTAEVTFDFILKNVGHSPAISVQIFPDLYVPTGPTLDPYGEQRKLCDRIRTIPILSVGETLFPDESSQRYREKVMIEPNAYAAAIAQSKFLFSLSLLGCIDYAFAVDTSARGHHQTRFNYDVIGTDGGALPWATDTPAQNIRLRKSFLGGFDAD